MREFHRQADAWYLDRPRYRLAGRSLGSGPPLYLLNGFVGSHELLALLVWLLRDTFRCVLFDYPVPRRGDWSLEELADDIAAVAEVSGDERIRLFGTTFGSLVALQTMQRHPRLVDRAVLHGGFAFRQLSLPERCLTSLGRWLPLRLRQLPGRVAIQRQNQGRWFPPFDQTRFQFYLDNTGATPVAALARCGRIVRQVDLRSQLSSLLQPVLLVHAEGDGSILNTCGEELAQLLPQVQVERLNDTGQIPYLTHPHRLAKVLRGFLGPPQ